MALHTLAVLVDNSPGVLARVAGLFSRRAYNIDSLAVGPTENPEISRMTIVINVEGHALEQVIRQLDKLVNVIHIAEMEPSNSTHAELLMVKVKNSSEAKSLATKFGAKVVDENADSITIEATGSTENISELLGSLKKIGIKELVQSGLVALERGATALSERTLEIQSVSTDTQADYQN
jgi:acetolactate synthase-1/3 small subunit